jgi:hypothetical protein
MVLEVDELDELDDDELDDELDDDELDEELVDDVEVDGGLIGSRPSARPRNDAIWSRRTGSFGQ